ncbi:FAD-binding oxidoreductase [Deinococcus sp. QL22]|uniref:FAD-binding oxidoreductase n=1 Tax=Deinococcus sp. QL22 TaxID=2939437 RepID=UPI002017838A|nr:FAD-binding oxidoreductase [Deinococcus sp. QL22]UQN08880.1 FAD-binding oxidoreductase [Deinococcus sp. QL22]
MPILELSPNDQTLTVTGDTPLLAVYAALPAGLYPPFPPVELPGGVGGLVSRGGFGQNFFFAAEVLGLTFISPSGQRIVAGGRTVKNVQGYDLTRPFVGSFGALGHAESVTLRLRPGRVNAHHSRTGRLSETADLASRFVWQAGETLHAFHIGHAAEVASVMNQFGGTPHLEQLNYCPQFEQGVGIGEHAILQDRRFRWANGSVIPVIPALFQRLASLL